MTTQTTSTILNSAIFQTRMYNLAKLTASSQELLTQYSLSEDLATELFTHFLFPYMRSGIF